MATIKKIEVGGTNYDIEDEVARKTATENTENIGNLSNLETTAKTNLVAAINEVNQNSFIAELKVLDDTSGTIDFNDLEIDYTIRRQVGLIVPRIILNGIPEETGTYTTGAIIPEAIRPYTTELINFRSLDGTGLVSVTILTNGAMTIRIIAAGSDSRWIPLNQDLVMAQDVYDLI